MNEEKEKKGSGCGIAIAVVLGLVFLIFFTDAPRLIFPRHKEQGSRQRCRGNLHGLGLSIAIWSMDHSETFPSSLVELAPGYADSPRIYRCPKDKREIGGIVNADEWSSYVLIPLPGEAEPDRINLFCRPENHNNEGLNVLFVDGSVTWMKPPEFEALMKEQGVSEYLTK